MVERGLNRRRDSGKRWKTRLRSAGSVMLLTVLGLTALGLGVGPEDAEAESSTIFVAYEAQPAGSVFPGASRVVLEGVSGGAMTPICVEMGPSSSVPMSDFFETFGGQFGLGAQDEVRLLSSTTDPYGVTHDRYQQFSKGLRVVGAEYIVHGKRGMLKSANGRLAILGGVNTAPTLSPDAALGMYLDRFDVHASEVVDVEMVELAVSSRGINLADPSTYHLVYVFELETLEIAYTLEIDAHDGTPINARPRHLKADAQRVGDTRYNGQRQITVNDDSPAGWRLFEHGRDLHVLDAQGQSPETGPPSNPSEFLDSDGNYVGDPTVWDAVSVKWGLEESYDYFEDVHGRSGWNTVAKLDAYVDWNTQNAFFNSTHKFLGFGPGWTPLDVVGHEYTHGIIDGFDALNLHFEGFALNESYSDIFGTMVEFTSTPGAADWLIADDRSTPLRSLQNPNQFFDPDTVGGLYWDTSGGPCESCHFDNPILGVSSHTLAGPHNFHFYLLSQGGSGVNDHGTSYSVTALGRTDAAKLGYQNLSHHLLSSSRYEDALEGELLSVGEAFAERLDVAAILDTVRESWRAIGLESEAELPPLPPSGLAATALANGQVRLTWQDNSNNEMRFQIQRKRPSGSFSDVGQVAADETLFVDNGVAPETTYRYRVRAENDAVGNSSWVGPVTVTTVASPPVLAPPSNLVVTASGCVEILDFTLCSVHLAWEDPSSEETSFRLSRSVNGSSNFVFHAEISADKATWKDFQVTAGNTYSYKIQACNTEECSAFSNTVSATISAAP